MKAIIILENGETKEHALQIIENIKFESWSANDISWEIQ